ncbi:hypothetical protein ES703_45458 [subsurface metagenome]|nr:hypothetical protein [bacterium]
MAKKDETKVKKSKATSKQRTTKPKKKKTKTPTPPEQPNWRQWLDTLSKGSFFLLAAIYLAGFLVVTIAYTKIGVPPPTSTIKYLSAGLVPLAIIVFAWVLVRRVIIINKDKPKFLSRLRLLLKSTFVLFVLAMLVFILLDGIFGISSYGKPLLDFKIDRLINKFTLLFTLTLLVPFIFTSLKLYFSTRKPQLSEVFSNLEFYSFVTIIAALVFFVKPGYQSTGLWIILSMIVFYWAAPEWEKESKSINFSTVWSILWPSLITILAYGALIYPTMSPLLGGGSPSKIIAYTYNHPLSNNFQTLPNSVIPIEAELIDKTGNEYILRIEDSLGNNHVVEISKNRVERIIYLSPKEIKARQARVDSLNAIQTADTTTTDTLSPAPDSS